MFAVDVGLQRPSPIQVKKDDFLPYGIVEVRPFSLPYYSLPSIDSPLQLARNLNTGGPGAWVNASLPLTSAITSPGTYYLIVTEHQREVYVDGQPTLRVQSYNRTVHLVGA
jgi:hypothetical protein